LKTEDEAGKIKYLHGYSTPPAAGSGNPVYLAGTESHGAVLVALKT
jgi:hypothetical protein